MNKPQLTSAKFLLTILFLALIAMCPSSCKKDSSNSGSNSVKLLTSSRWTFLKFEYYQNGAWIADPDAIDADEFTVGFNINNTFSENDIRNGETSPGTWNFSSNNTVLTTTGGLDIYAAVYTVTQLSASTLKITNLNYPLYSGERLTFTH